MLGFGGRYLPLDLRPAFFRDKFPVFFETVFPPFAGFPAVLIRAALTRDSIPAMSACCAIVKAGFSAAILNPDLFIEPTKTPEGWPDLQGTWSSDPYPGRAGHSIEVGVDPIDVAIQCQPQDKLNVPARRIC